MSNEYLDEFVKLGGPFGFGAMDAILDKGDGVLMSYMERETNAIMQRRRLVMEYAWAVPTPDLVTLVASHSPIVEVGAGGGYWAMLLRDAGADVVAYDRDPDPKHNIQVGRTWSPVTQAFANVAGRHPDRTLFLCWPPYAEAMAHDALRAYLDAGGRTLVYIGERRGGCTGDDAFFDLLNERMDEADTHGVPGWPGLHDYLTIYERKETRT